eukprot:Sdes_comp9503_c0_seq1m973
MSTLLSRSAFYENLQQFHAENGTASVLKKRPRFYGVDFDIYEFYQRILKHGGEPHVSDHSFWERILLEYKLAHSFTNARYMLSFHYDRLLKGFDAWLSGRHLSKPQIGKPKPIIERPVIKHKDFPINQEPLPYGSLHKHGVHGCLEKVCFSLHSGLPNEIDWAFQVLEMLFYDSYLYADFNLHYWPSLADEILRHAEIYYEPFIEEIVDLEQDRFFECFHSRLLNESNSIESDYVFFSHPEYSETQKFRLSQISN